MYISDNTVQTSGTQVSFLSIVWSGPRNVKCKKYMSIAAVVISIFSVASGTERFSNLTEPMVSPQFSVHPN